MGGCMGVQAIDAYRTAVTINQRDYRAWYGLGQTYELLRALISSRDSNGILVGHLPGI